MEKLYFTPQQAEEIKKLLDLRLTTSDKDEFKRISSRLRNRGFYISQFSSKFSSTDFNKEVEKGNIIITESPINYQSANNYTQQIPQYNDYPNTSDKNKKSNIGVISLIVLAFLWLIGTLTSEEDKESEVIKGSSYNSSYDQQINDLKRDIKKSDDWVEGIVVYDENCDTIAVVNR